MTYVIHKRKRLADGKELTVEEVVSDILGLYGKPIANIGSRPLYEIWTLPNGEKAILIVGANSPRVQNTHIKGNTMSGVKHPEYRLIPSNDFNFGDASRIQYN
jgi:hypothetical protein